MEKNKLELAAQKIVNVIKKPNKSFLFYGGWGIGKTHLFKNEIYKKLIDGGKNVIYYDIRNSLFYNDPISTFRDMFSDQKTDQNKVQVVKNTIKAFSVLSNIVFKTNIPIINTNQNIKKVIKQLSDRETIIIFDEFDRVSGDVILKSLNLLNIISMNEKIKIICIGNQDEMNSILSQSMGTSEKAAEDFLYKYFEKEVNLDELISIPIIENVLHKNNFPSCEWLYILNPKLRIKKSARKIARWIRDVKWIEPHCSVALLKYSFFIYITNFNSHNRVIRYTNGLQIRHSNNSTLNIHNDSNFSIIDREIPFLWNRDLYDDEEKVLIIPKIAAILNEEEKCKDWLKNKIKFDFDDLLKNKK